MIPPKDNSGFDDFFNQMAGSKDFANIAKDIENIGNSLKEMDKNINTGNDIQNAFNTTFATPEAIGEGKKTQAENNSQTEKQSINVEYFENKNPATFGFAGIAGMNELKQELNESFIKPIKFKILSENLETNKEIDPKKAEVIKKLYDEYKKFKINIPTGLLFYGPPGTGKTFITKKLAQELGAGFIAKSVGEFGSSYQHQTTKNIKEFFTQAKEVSKKGPIILFLDEIDSILSKRTNNIDAQKAEEVSQFLQEFNNLADAQNLIVIAATNRPDHLDPAILRSGRLDKKIYIGPPDTIARKELFEIYIQKEDRPHEELDFDELAVLTEGYVAADIETICDEVSRDASNHILELANSLDLNNFNEEEVLKNLESKKITMDLLKQAILDTTSSLKMTDMSIYETWLKEIE